MKATSNSPTVPTIVYGVTIPLSARAFLIGQLRLVVEAGAEVHLIYGSDSPGPVTEIDPRVHQHQVPVRRNPAPREDVAGLWHMIRLLRDIRPDKVVLGTPKMGLLGLLAARLVGVPRRVYILYGLRLEGATGPGRIFLWLMEWITMTCSTEILAISESNRSEAVRLRLTRAERISVVGEGNIVGVDLDRFTRPTAEQRVAVRLRYDLPCDAPVIGFVGRLTTDKGLVHMVETWRLVNARVPHAWFLVVGPVDASEGLDSQIAALGELTNVRMVGPVTDPESAFMAMDVLLLLTKREGFGTVVIEAGACGVPAVATRVSGVVDAVRDGETGTLVGLGDHDAAAQAATAYLEDPALRETHGRAAEQRVRTDFESTHVDRTWASRVLASRASEDGTTT